MNPYMTEKTSPPESQNNPYPPTLGYTTESSNQEYTNEYQKRKPDNTQVSAPEIQAQPQKMQREPADADNMFSPRKKEIKQTDPPVEPDNIFSPETDIIPEAPTINTNESLIKDVEVKGVELNNSIMQMNVIITEMMDVITSGEKCNLIMEKKQITLLDEVQALVREIKSITTSFELLTDKHIQIIRSKYKEEMLSSIDVTMLSIVLNTNNNNYKDRLFAYINMINHFVSLSSLIFKCSDSWFGDDNLSMETKKHIYLYLDYFQHNISYIITQELYFKKYSSDANLNEVLKWNKDSANRKLQKESHYAILKNKYKKSKTACVIS